MTALRRIGPYTLVKQLGRGSSGQVFLAKREGIERPLALKLLPARLDPEGRARLDREARVASRLEHPGLVRVVDVGDLGQQPYLVMEYVPGRNLMDWIGERPGGAPWRKAVGLCRAVAEALQAVHEAGVIHRDLKPANVILDERDGRPRVTDFGLAHDLRSDLQLTGAGDVLGTPYYMAPEQVRGARVDARVDIYALGVILYEMLAGHRPYEARDVPSLYPLIEAGRAQPLGELRADLPPGLAELCMRSFAPLRGDRPGSAGELAEQLGAIADGDGDQPGAPSAASAARADAAPAPRGPLLAGAALAALLTLGVLAWSSSWADQARAQAATRAEAEQTLEQTQARLAGEREELATREQRLAELQQAVTEGESASAELRQQVSGVVERLRVEGARALRPLGTLAAAMDQAIELARSAGAAVVAADLLRDRGRLREAAELAHAAWEQGARDPELLVVEFRSWSAMGRIQAQESVLRTLLEQAPQGSLQRVFAQAISGGLGDTEATLTAVREAAAAADPPRAYMWILAGQLLLNDRVPGGGMRPADWEAVLADAERAIALSPCCADARQLRILALLGLRRAGQPRAGDVDQVLEDCLLAREVDPKPDYWLLAGRMLTAVGEPDAALLELEEAGRRATPGSTERAVVSAAEVNAQLALGDGQAAEDALRLLLSSRAPLEDALGVLELDRAPTPLRTRLLGMVDSRRRGDAGR